jgi:ABC-type transport system substrate-binding protein
MRFRRKHPTWLFLGIAALGAALLSFAACGGDDDGSATTATDTATTATTTEMTTSAPAEAAAAPTPIAAVVAAPETSPQEPAAAATPSASTPATAASGDTMTQTDPKVERLVFGINMSQETTSPPLGGGGIAGFISLRPMYEFLVDITPDRGQFVPMLATEWSIEGGDKIRFKLREGVPFHKDQGEFTAKDVVHTWEQVTREDADHGNTTLFRSATDHIEIVNDYEVLWHLTSPEAELFWIISQMSAGGMEIQSKDHFDALASGDPEFRPSFEGEAIAGTAPYQFNGREQAQNIRFARVPYDHWQLNADFPEFEWRIINENSTRQAALFAGEIHIAALPEDLKVQAEARGMKNIAGRVKGLRTFMSFNCCYMVDGSRAADAEYLYPDSRLLDGRVRKALNKAVDKNALNEAFFNNKGFPMYHTHLNENTLGWDPSWETRYPAEYGYDPAAAMELLREAGYSENNPLEVTTYSEELTAYAGASDVVDVIVNYWSEVGVKVTLEAYDPTRFRSAERGFEVYNDLDIVGTSSYPFVAQRIYNWAYRATSNNFTSPEINVLGTKVRGILDLEEQDKAWREWGEAIFSQHANLNLFWLPAEATVDPNVVESWVFPSNVTGTFTHITHIKGVR